MLKINKLEVTFESNKEIVKALGPISLDIESGDIYAIIGPSGCGKSTLLNILSGILPDESQAVTLNDEKLDPKKHKIGFIPQNFGLLPWNTVYQNCVLALNIKGIKIDQEIEERIAYIMSKLN
ncbi:MAG: ATP-binding cassette domain-containing protein, partial [Turicibacter sp.]